MKFRLVMEYLVPEQMFSTDEAPAQGISAVKAIAQAAAEGQRIYTITSSNLYTAMAQLQPRKGLAALCRPKGANTFNTSITPMGALAPYGKAGTNPRWWIRITTC
ncbi:hypothetical protein [Porticoccus sp.]